MLTTNGQRVRYKIRGRKKRKRKRKEKNSQRRFLSLSIYLSIYLSLFLAENGSGLSFRPDTARIVPEIVGKQRRFTLREPAISCFVVSCCCTSASLLLSLLVERWISAIFELDSIEYFVKYWVNKWTSEKYWYIDKENTLYWKSSWISTVFETVCPVSGKGISEFQMEISTTLPVKMYIYIKGTSFVKKYVRL